MKADLPIRIAGVGRYLPERVVLNPELEARIGLPEGWIEEKTGVRQRRFASGETASFMGAHAALEAMRDARVPIADIDLIIGASATAEQMLPDGGSLLQRELNQGRSGIPCLSVNTTCLSFVTALDLTSTLIASGRYRNVLIVSSEIASVGLNYEERESASLFGDGAAAAVITRSESHDTGRVHGARQETYSEGAFYTAVMGGGTKHHPNDPETRPEMNLFSMDGRKIYKLAHRHLGAFFERLFKDAPFSRRDLDLVIPHQASLYSIRSLRKYDFPEEKVFVTLSKYGNTIAASIPMALYEAIRTGRIRRGDRAMMVGTAAGLTFGAILFTY